MVKSFEQCAEECADTWFAKEAAFVADLSSGDTTRRLAALQRAAGHFKIARTMPTAHDVGIGRPRLAPVLDILDDARLRQVTAESLPAAVRLLRQRLAAAYHKADLLSASTKFLWLLHRDVAVIFDSQARVALGTPQGDYDTFLDRWRHRYQAALPRIEEACARVGAAKDQARARAGLPYWGVQALASEPWFPMRVLDIQLWYEGNVRS